jgi:hypothetical protein
MALRYPKILSCDTTRGIQGGMNSSAGRVDAGEVQFQNNCCIIVAPSRYSAVRRVVFSLCLGKLGSGTTMTAALKIGVQADAFDTAQPTKFAAPPTSIHESASDYGMVGVQKPRFTFNGPVETIPQVAVTAGERDHALLLQIEFDRFNPLHTDFFVAWDQYDDDDDYMVLFPVVNIATSDGFPGSVAARFKTFQCAVIQAPDNPNNSSTDFTGFNGCNDALENTTAFINLNFAGRHAFHFFAEDWDGLDTVTVLAYGSTSTATSLTIRVHDYTAGATLFDEVFALSSLFYVVRTQDFKALLTDGHVYGFFYLLVGPNNTTDPRQNGHFTVTQKGFTKTATAHTVPGLAFTPSVVVTTPMEAVLFDPLWYEDFSDAQILKNKMFSAFNHNAGANNPRQVVRLDTNLLSDDSARLSGSAVDVAPEHTFSGLPLTTQFQFTDITANDPIRLAGQRRLQLSFLGTSSWLSAPGDFPGEVGLYYALDVPTTEQPELGPLFQLGAFNPEGCASTSAGLGDHPGLLVISNGETLPQHFNPLAGVVENNSLPVPFCDEVPQVTSQDAGVSPDNGLQLGIYTYRYTFRNCCTLKESDPNPDDIVIDTSGNAPAANVTLSFANVRIPGDEQICEICIYRTIVGGDFPIMAKVGCFDPDLTSLFVDDVADSALDFINDGLSLLNGPMPCVPVVAEFRNRIFGMGDIPDLSPAGTVTVVNGSDIITGDDDVEWDRCLERKFIQIEGDCRTYEIEKVLPPVDGTSPAIQRLLLVDEYEGTSDLNVNYIICGRPNRLYFSEPLEAECWPAALFLDIEPGDGDRLMGAVSNFNSLVICKRNKTYVLQFHEQPATEVVVPTRISSDIGCIGPRTFAQVESGSVWLSDRGVVLYDGRSVRHLPESEQMNNLFIDPENPNYVRRDRNGRVIGAVGVFYPKREQYLLLLPTVKTVRGANLMLVWDLKLHNITLLEFCQEFMSMVVAKDSDGNERVYLGDTNGFTWIYDIGDNDGVGFPNQTGTVRGTVSAAGTDSFGASFFDDNTASFITGGLPGLAGLSGIVGLSGAFFEGDLGLAGVCIFTRAAGAPLDTPWKVRTAFASTETRVYVTPGWGVDEPDPGDDYMLGPINFISLFKPMNYGTDDMLKRNWRQVLTYDIEEVSSQVRVELLPDLQNSDPEELTVLSGEPPATGAGRVFDMAEPRGRQIQPVGRLIYNYMGVRLTNFAPEEPIRILNHELAVTPKISK